VSIACDALSESDACIDDDAGFINDASDGNVGGGGDGGCGLMSLVVVSIA
jgi:hypothetical protein